MNRRAILNTLAATLLANTWLSRQARAVETAPVFVEISDELLKTMIGPRIDEALRNMDFRKEMCGQFERCFGEKYRELQFKCMLDANPDLQKNYPVLQAMRERLKLPKITPTKMRMDLKRERGEL